MCSTKDLRKWLNKHCRSTQIFDRNPHCRQLAEALVNSWIDNLCYYFICPKGIGGTTTGAIAEADLARGISRDTKKDIGTGRIRGPHLDRTGSIDAEADLVQAIGGKIVTTEGIHGIILGFANTNHPTR